MPKIVMSVSQHSALYTPPLRRQMLLIVRIIMMLLLILVSRDDEQFAAKAFSSHPQHSMMKRRTQQQQLFAVVVQGVTLKIAIDSQGGVVDLVGGRPERFTSEASLDMVHRLRRESNAVLVGKHTVLNDNPSLTVRRGIVVVDKEQQQPLRVVLDSQLELLSSSSFSNNNNNNNNEYTLLTDGLPTIIYHCRSKDESGEQVQVPSSSLQCIRVPAACDNGSVDVAHVLQDLMTKQHVKHVMVEGGPAVARAFLKQRLVDRVLLVQALGVTFQEPLLLSEDNTVLFENAGLQMLGSYESQTDVIQCWSKKSNHWPTDDLQSWP